MMPNPSVPSRSRRPNHTADHRTAKKTASAPRHYAVLLLSAPLVGLCVLVLLLLLFAQILSKTADPDTLAAPCVLAAVFVSGGVCGKIAAKTDGKPFPWCILSCVVLALLGILLSFCFGLCADTDRLFKSAVFLTMLAGGIGFSLSMRKKERRPKR